MGTHPAGQQGNDAATAAVIARPPLLFLAAVLLGLASDRVFAWPLAPKTDLVRWITAGLLILGGLALAAAGIRNFSRAATPVPTNEPTRALVTTGIHGWTRNPIYLGMFLLYGGIGIAAASAWILALALPLAMVMRYGVVAREEAYLERRFGEAYRAYRARVRRWLPALPAWLVIGAGGALLVAALIFGCSNWQGFGFDESGPEMAQLADALSLSTGMVVADVGAGNGQLTLALARVVGAGGHVFSTEIDPGRLRRLRETIAAAGLGNVAVVAAKASESGLPAGCCDAVVLRRVYHHLSDPKATNASLLRALRPGGLLAVIDLPPPPFFLDRSSLGVAAEIVVDEITASGFEKLQLRCDWPGRGPLGSYCVIFRKPRQKAETGQPPGLSCRRQRGQSPGFLCRIRMGQPEKRTRKPGDCPPRTLALTARRNRAPTRGFRGERRLFAARSRGPR